MKFIPIHFSDRLMIINPMGRIGVVTLWSKVDYIAGRLKALGVNLDPKTSNVAVIGTLYGNGLPQLLRNLLYNPQIELLVVCGSDRSGSAKELEAFFANGLEETESLGRTVIRIKGTKRIIDDLVKPEMFKNEPRIISVGDLRKGFARGYSAEIFNTCVSAELGEVERLEVPMPKVSVRYFPSEPTGHQIIEATPLQAWRSLVKRIVRFGHMIHLAKGDRQELPNVRVVITDPRPDDPAELERYGIAMEDLVAYQGEMLSPGLPEDQPYAYGNRIREYFGHDALKLFVERLAKDPDDRHCYHALWDSKEDGTRKGDPCMVSIFFRYFDGKLLMTAMFRAHNALDAWIKNVYGLMKIQEFVAAETGLPVGALTVFSNSISVDPVKYDTALRIAGSNREFEIHWDPCGQFRIEVDHKEKEIVVLHLGGLGEMLSEYRSAKAERLQHELAQDCAISDINHAIYVGRQLARAEACLASGEVYEQ